MWFISNNSNLLVEKFTKINFKSFYFQTDKDTFLSNDNKTSWYYDGHILPRQNVEQKLKTLDTIDLISSLFIAHGHKFINYIKGNFILIRIEKNCFNIYSDRFGIRKFFLWRKDDQFIITDNLKSIANQIKLEPSKTNIVTYSLTFHFTGGTTLFENVKHNIPGQIIYFNGEKINTYNYWNPNELLNQPFKKIKVDDISEELGKAVESRLTFTNTNKISLSLTGGGDTRNLLAVFLKKQLNPHLYTYGNPASSDCVKASTIAKGLGLNHDIHDINMDSNTFEKYARKIIRLSSGLASIHRVHRLMAVELEKQYANWMFLGTLGGEYVKGVGEDGYIDPPIVYENWRKSDFNHEFLKSYFIDKKIRFEENLAEDFLSFLQNEPYMIGSVTLRKHQTLSYITAHVHDAQDVNLYRSIMDDVYTPFLDIDYLELLFSSEFSFDKKELKSNKYLKKLDNPIYSSNFLKQTYPPLLQFMYSGEHHPKEVLFNKYYAALLKVIRKKTKPKDPPNFPLTNWMYQFVKEQLPKCQDYKILNETFNLPELIFDLENCKHKTVEAYWLKFTNPIMMRFILEEYAYE